MSESEALRRKQPCPDCGSSDGLTVYSDGHTFCFAQCGAKFPEGSAPSKPKTAAGLIPFGVYADIAARGLREETLKKFGYFLKEHTKHGMLQVAPYRDGTGEIVAQKIRTPEKDFAWVGNPKRLGLWGQHLWTPRPDSNVFLTITEGEPDCMSVAQAQGLKYPVVSLINGAASAGKDIASQIEWVEQFPFVVLCFDMDGPGKEAALEVAQMLTPGKVRIAALPLKDASDMLQAKRSKELIDALFNAKPYAPEGVINGADILEELKKAPEKALVPFPWPQVEEMTGGFWPGSLTTIAAGTNAGKTPLVYNLVHHLLAHGETVGVLHTEQQHKEAALGIMQLELEQRLDPRLQHGKEKGFDKAFKKTIGSGRWFYFTVDLGPDELLSKVLYLVQACGCQWIVIDHLHDIVANYAGADERRFVDGLMAKLKSIAVRFGVGIFVVAQLSLPEGNKGFEHGIAVTMKAIKGAGSISQVSAVILGYERNLMDAQKAKVGRLRVLKNRHGGRTGLADSLFYEDHSGRLRVLGEHDFKDETEGEAASI
ncbi:AAA family ATPase [Hyphomicrobium sp. xq]|uniref:AAA family ATPase n=1 Tax=Hyphomicrobium album TaxID=2665159 RepID=A0A6I3KBU4_9HYPH|nr:DnaB-like helicase C-terminal domain-containing protein [Hyphomicrobium album]MTD92895.1 AAA family ATPase [Hyphomicrobium album]